MARFIVPGKSGDLTHRELYDGRGRPIAFLPGEQVELWRGRYYYLEYHFPHIRVTVLRVEWGSGDAIRHYEGRITTWPDPTPELRQEELARVGAQVTLQAMGHILKYLEELQEPRVAA